VLQGKDGSTVLQPGANRLAFQVTVLKPGLYTLKHLHVRLGRLSLRLRAALPEDEGPPAELLTAPPMTPALSEAQSNAQQLAIGDVDSLGGLMAPPHIRSDVAKHKRFGFHHTCPACSAANWESDLAGLTMPSASPGFNRSSLTACRIMMRACCAGRLREVAVLLNAHACQPRLRLTAAAQRGRLVAGHLNWLGLALQPLHDALLDLQVHAAPAPPAAADLWVLTGSMPGCQQDSR
jgi:hypothetical protein